MRWAPFCGALGVVLALGVPCAADTVRDPRGNFTVQVADLRGRICTALPVPAGATAAPPPQQADADAGAGGSADAGGDGPCTPVDIAMGQALQAADVNGTNTVGMVVAHFDGWDETLYVTRTEPHESDVTQAQADEFIGGLRAGIRKRLPLELKIIGENMPAHADILQLGGVQVVRGSVRIQRPADALPSAAARSKIAYQVIAKGATYVLLFSADDEHYTEALAFADRTAATLHTTAADPSPASELERGKRWALVFGVAVVVIFAAMKILNRRKQTEK